MTGRTLDRPRCPLPAGCADVSPISLVSVTRKRATATILPKLKSMPIEIVGIVAVVLSILALYKGYELAIRIFIPSTLFGAAAAVNAPGVGSIQPAQLLLATLGLVVVADAASLRRLIAGVRFPAPGFWLLCTWISGTLGAVFVPRLLATTFMVNAIGSSPYGETGGQVPFGPTTGNISQTIYFTGDLVCFLACLAVAGTPHGFRTVFRALLVYCGCDVAFALIDLGTYYTGTAGLLDVVRNAKYVIYVDTDASNLKRIIGSFTEASAFAGATLGILGFCAKSWVENLHPRLSLALALAALALLLLSTSSTAYVGLTAGAAFLYGTSAWAIIRNRASGRDVAIAVIGPVLLGCCILGILLYPPISKELGDFFDAMVFNKLTSQSGIDRGLLNQQALQNIVDTSGIGTGIGGVRASSFVLAVLANLGIVGGLAYATFVGTALAGAGRPSADETVRRTQTAARTACIWLLISASISGTLIDLGLPFFVFAALACARPDAAQTGHTCLGKGRSTGQDANYDPLSPSSLRRLVPADS